MSTHRVIIVVRDGIQILDAAGPHEVFAGANTAGANYELVIASPDGGPVRSESGMTVESGATLSSIRRVDTLMVAGGSGMRAAVDDTEFIRQVQRLAGRAQRVTSVCTGAAILAGAGLLAGRRATTHWAHSAWLAERWPDVRVEPDTIYVRDGHIWTSAGVTAGMDLALALVALDHGHDMAHMVASHLVMYTRRAGGQSQFSPQLEAAAPTHPSLRSLLAALPDQLDQDLSIRVLADQACMSERTFVRAFRAETGVTAATHVESLRVDATRRLLETTDLTVGAIAPRVGFRSAETLHRAFRRRAGTTPDSYRRHFSHR